MHLNWSKFRHLQSMGIESKAKFIQYDIFYGTFFFSFQKIYFYDFVIQEQLSNDLFHKVVNVNMNS